MAIEPEPMNSIESAVKLPDETIQYIYSWSELIKRDDSSRMNEMKMQWKIKIESEIAHFLLTFARACLFP